MKFPVRTAPMSSALMAVALMTAALCSGAAAAGDRAARSDQHDTAMKIAPAKLAMGPVSAPQKPGGSGGGPAADPPGCDGSCAVRHKTVKHRRH